MLNSWPLSIQNIGSALLRWRTTSHNKATRPIYSSYSCGTRSTNTGSWDKSWRKTSLGMLVYILQDLDNIQHEYILQVQWNLYQGTPQYPRESVAIRQVTGVHSSQGQMWHYFGKTPVLCKNVRWFWPPLPPPPPPLWAWLDPFGPVFGPPTHSFWLHFIVLRFWPTFS